MFNPFKKRTYKRDHHGRFAPSKSPPIPTIAPILSTKILSRDGFSFSVESDNLYSNPSICLINEITGDTVNIPAEFVPVVLEARNYLPIYSHIESQKMRTFPPTSYADLIQDDGIEEWNGFILKGDDYFANGTPYIRWISEDRKYGRPEPGWQLEIMGAPGMVVGEAQWDDEAGVRTLVELMNDRESLFIQAALLDPKGMEWFVKKVEREEAGLPPYRGREPFGSDEPVV